MQEKSQQSDSKQNQQNLKDQIKNLIESKDIIIPFINYNIKLKKLFSLTNDVYKITISQENNKYQKQKISLLYKRYRNDLVYFIDRQIELFILKSLSDNKQYPKIYYINQKLRIQEFVEGQQLAVEKVDNQTLEQFVKILAHFSKIYTPLYLKQFKLKQKRDIKFMWSQFNKIFQLMKQKQPQLVQQVKFFVQKILDQKVFSTLSNFLTEQMILSHNDSHLGNIIQQKNKKIQVLDFQFVSLNYLGFDLGNFFNQFATKYHNGFQIKQEWELSSEKKKKLTEIYFQQLQYEVISKEIIINFGRLLSHLFWFFIGLRQIGDKQNGLDMIYYIKRRYQQFKKYYMMLTGQII